MSFAGKLMQAYLNFAYIPANDFIVAELNRYRELQQKCVAKLELNDNEKVPRGSDLPPIMIRPIDLELPVF